MAISDPLFDQVCEAVKSLANELHANQSNPTWKKIENHVGFKTVADQIMHEKYLHALHLIDPHTAVFSEEVPHTLADRPDRYWLIDPIDGTRSWEGGFEGYVSQVALIEGSKAVFGAICQPAENRFWRSDQILSKAPFAKHLRIIDNYPSPTGIAAKLKDHLPDSAYIECGSLGLKSILTLQAYADIFVKDTIVRDWDIAPALAFIVQNGGFINDLQGRPLHLGETIEFHNGMVVCHSYTHWEKALQALNQYQ